MNRPPLNADDSPYDELVRAVDALMAYLGHYGTIDAKSELADAVMDALQKVDPK